MSAVFLKIVNMSIAAGWAILAVLLLRLLLKKAPKGIICLLWAVAALRLICPFSLESVLSLIPSAETVPADIEMMGQPAVNTGLDVINDAVNPLISGSLAPEPYASANPLQVLIPFFGGIWLAGVAVMLGYALISYLKLRKTVSASLPAEEGVMLCDEIPSPFILGIFRPRIYLPSSLEEPAKTHVLAHERAHLKRRDHLWKPLGFLLLSVYRFNPLCWIAYVMLCRDIEAACDEKVIQDMNEEAMAAYSQALLDCSFSRRRIAACPLAFGETGVKERVKHVLNYKKPAFWIILIAVIACIIAAVCLLTDPKKKTEPPVEEPSSEEPTAAVSKTFAGTVTRVGKETFYVQPDEGSAERLSSSCFELPASALVQKEVPAVGDRAEVTYSGNVQEVYPARPDNVESVKLIRQHVPQAKFFSEAATYVRKEPFTAAKEDRTEVQMRPYVFFDGLSYDASGSWTSCWDIAMSFSLQGTYSLQGDRIKAVQNGGADVPAAAEQPWMEFRILSENELEVTKISDDFFSRATGNPQGWLQEGDILVWWDGVALPEMQTTQSPETASGEDRQIEFRYTISYAGYSSNSEIEKRCLNPQQMTGDIIDDCPLYRLGSVTEMESFKKAFQDILTFDYAYNEIPSFNDAAAAYDDSFFMDHDLILVYVGSGSGSDRYELEEVVIKDGCCSLTIRMVNPFEFKTANMAGWFVIAEVRKQDLAGVTSFEAQQTL